jgi:ribosomal protein S6
MRLYEALYLIESGRAATDWEATEGALLSILEKHGGKVRQKAYYEERKLAYPVKGARRGAYLLVHFEADPLAIQEIHGDLNLSDVALRTMITVLEGEELPELKAIGNAEPSTPKTREQREAERRESEARAAAAAAAERAAEADDHDSDDGEDDEDEAEDWEETPAEENDEEIKA